MTYQLDKMSDSKYNFEMKSLRREQVGSGMRGDKIRTYRFQDDRVVDHRTGKKASCERVLKGNFNLLW